MLSLASTSLNDTISKIPVAKGDCASTWLQRLNTACTGDPPLQRQEARFLPSRKSVMTQVRNEQIIGSILLPDWYKMIQMLLE